MATTLTIPAPPSAVELEELFASLARRWKEERGPSSSPTEMALCPS